MEPRPKTAEQQLDMLATHLRAIAQTHAALSQLHATVHKTILEEMEKILASPVSEQRSAEAHSGRDSNSGSSG